VPHPSLELLLHLRPQEKCWGEEVKGEQGEENGCSIKGIEECLGPDYVSTPSPGKLYRTINCPADTHFDEMATGRRV
jgi:hypothetical protein